MNGNDVKNVLNKISGTFTVKLNDRLFPTDKKLSDLEDIYSALVALNEMGEMMEAVRMIRGLSGIAGEEYPYLIAAFEDQKEIQEIFLDISVYAAGKYIAISIEKWLFYCAPSMGAI